MGMATESQFHVLAVDDSLVDRKMIERLLQKSSCQGKQQKMAIGSLSFVIGER